MAPSKMDSSTTDENVPLLSAGSHGSHSAILKRPVSVVSISSAESDGDGSPTSATTFVTALTSVPDGVVKLEKEMGSAVGEQPEDGDSQRQVIDLRNSPAPGSSKGGGGPGKAPNRTPGKGGRDSDGRDFYIDEAKSTPKSSSNQARYYPRNIHVAWETVQLANPGQEQRGVKLFINPVQAENPADTPIFEWSRGTLPAGCIPPPPLPADNFCGNLGTGRHWIVPLDQAPNSAPNAAMVPARRRPKVVELWRQEYPNEREYPLARPQ